MKRYCPRGTGSQLTCSREMPAEAGGERLVFELHCPRVCGPRQDDAAIGSGGKLVRGIEQCLHVLAAKAG